MPEELKTFEAVFAQWRGQVCRLVAIAFYIDDEKDALEIAEEIALLEARELIYLAKKE